MRAIPFAIVLYATLVVAAVIFLAGCGVQTIEDVVGRQAVPHASKPIQCADEWCTQVHRAPDLRGTMK